MLPGRHLRNQPWRGSLLNSPDGKKCCTYPSLWWLQGSSLIHQEVQSRLICLWRIIISIQRWPPQKHPPHARIRSCSVRDTNSWFPGGNCLPNGSITGGGPKAPLGPLAVGMMTAPGVSTVSASHIIRDEVTGATYLDMVTTSVGRVALSGPESETPAQGPKIEDVADLHLKDGKIPAFGW